MASWFLCASSDSYSILYHACAQAVMRSSVSDCGHVIVDVWGAGYLILMYTFCSYGILVLMCFF